MTAGETGASASVSGFVVGEQVTLTTTPTGTNYAWIQSIPISSGPAKSRLSDDTGASVSFVPDVGGIYVVGVQVDAVTVYTLSLSVTDTAVSSPYEAIRLQQIADAGVPAPVAGAVALYESIALAQLVQKNDANRITPIGPVGTIGANLTDADQTLLASEGVHRSIPESTQTAIRTKTLGTSGALLGDVIWIHRFDVTSFTTPIVNGGPGAGTLLTFAASARVSAAFKFDSTNWILHERRRLT